MGGRGEKTARGEEEEAQQPREEEGGGSGEPKAKRARGGGAQQQGQGQEQLSLAIQPPVPRFPFVNHFFDVHVHLFDQAHQVKTEEEFELPLQVQLLLDDKDADKRVPVPASKADQVLEVDPKEPRLGRNGKASFRVRVKDVSMNYDNRPMLLQVSAAGPKGKGAAAPAAAASAAFSIAPVVSDPMTVIRHRLRIRSETQPPTVWYKDEGGRDKCIEIMVDLVDPEGRRVHGQQEVPLKVSLLYEDLHAVGKQDILKLSSDSRQAIDATGTATLRLRIEDVSKNHQSKGFVVRVAPDVAHAPLNADISPDISTSVSVRSKRNRRSKHPGAGGAGAGGLHHAHGHGGGAHMDDESVSLVGHAMGGRSSMELAMPGVPHSILQDAAQLSMQAASASAGGGANGGAGGAGVDGGGAAAGGVEGAVAGVVGPPVIRALSNVIAWTRAVVNGLYQIQWQLIGYESRPDGSPDISKPLFNIHNPNAVVTNILQSYRAETMDQLRFLVEALEPSQGGASAVGGQQGPGQKSDQQATAGQAYGGDGAQGGGGGGAGGGQEAFYGGDGGGGGGQGHPGQGRPQLAPMPLLPPMSRAASAARADAGGEFGAGVGGMLPLVRESTYDLLAGMDPSWFGDAEGPSAAVVAEASVQSVVAKEYTSPTYDTLGFPAFDAKEALVGFFKEGRNEQGQTVAFFVPLPPSFAEEERRAAVGMLQDEKARGGGGGGGGGGGAVVQMVNNDIVQLKERVLTYHWSKGGEGRDGGGSIQV